VRRAQAAMGRLPSAFFWGKSLQTFLRAGSLTLWNRGRVQALISMAMRGRAKERLRRFGGDLVPLRSSIGISSCAAGTIGVRIFYQSVSD
jgi:hypothetical protein